MSNEHPITPPPELMQQWRNQAPTARDAGVTRERWIATQAASWGADQELGACCEWLEDHDCDDPQEAAKHLRTARRPKPPSLNSIALQMLDTIERDARYLPEMTDTIRSALEALPE